MSFYQNIGLFDKDVGLFYKDTVSDGSRFSRVGREAE